MKSLIVLIGMMGSGKTTVGKQLAELLGWTFIDLDEEIEKRENKKISQIFNDNGEQYFRKTEKEAIKEFINNEKTILSLGGGAFENEESQKLLKEKSTVIFLKASCQKIFERIKNEIHRPLLHKNFSIETIEFILQKRQKNYDKAHHKIITDNKTPQEIANEILGVIK
ncbi:MAG: shikimate kinase [Cyanobacteria bacterium SIG32]|nr:shikimate kinase [Cyanobacteria bacterium SIG32]